MDDRIVVAKEIVDAELLGWLIRYGYVEFHRSYWFGGEKCDYYKKSSEQND